METLAYLHLALADEAPLGTNELAIATLWKSPKLLAKFIAFSVVLGVVGMASHASAALRQGDYNPEVTTLQERLQKLGYLKANATGYFGSLTKRAVIEFQEAEGLAADGVVGANTQAALDQEVVSNASDGLLKVGDRGEKVSDIQRRLEVAGHPVGEIGTFDEVTLEAVQKFQREKGLKVDGIVGQQTLAALPEIAPKLKEEKTSEPESSTSWYESESAPLDPFLQPQPDETEGATLSP
ncbi:peptidoglycan-binding protein [Microcoleus sp. FACHB-SPT15]|jgi:peptidoglycan hydrolase-like protein with peptidoglycan-binding domain|uniref:peptidoglycan-binding domain-containing protein n=1 Tax=Microcoleus sp. FACHB-SPT15 TaxID=2692830 RepID=UPI00177B8A25|nr:peptidoglycan-binding protein [Microcoleus sp. FACHB-SPT15]MBD1804772.1 peptidoglycan-binding protein [Microcoleus sp. FACHB-SPT15]